MELENQFISPGVGGDREREREVGEGTAGDGGLNVEIRVEAGEEDEKRGIGGVDSGSGSDHVSFPGAPAVGLESGSKG